MTIEIQNKKLTAMTNAELQKIKEAISEIEMQRQKEHAEKLKKLFSELTDEG